MDILYGQLPPKAHRAVMAYGHFAYVLVALFNAVWFMAAHRTTIPADGAQAAQFLGIYTIGCLGLFALIPLGYTVTAYLQGLVLTYREAMAISALPWFAYSICQVFSQSSVAVLQVLALPLLLVWVIWPFGMLTSQSWTKTHPNVRSAIAHGLCLGLLVVMSLGFGWLNRLPIFQFAPAWYSQPALSQMSQLPGTEPVPAAAEKILPIVKQMLQREGLPGVKIDNAVVFRADQSPGHSLAEFGFKVTEREFHGLLYVLFDLNGTAISYELGRAPTIKERPRPVKRVARPKS